ncbi:unnamed protein product [Dicrocoelium dendriticum]|nr:unnamed protein product [Dicrocoelium dendriticum]
MGLHAIARRLFGDHIFDVDRWSYLRVFTAVIIHETLGLGILVGFWAGCYKFRPLHRMLTLAPKSVQNAYGKGMNWSTKKLQRVPSFVRRRTDPNRLLISGAESFALRKLLLPITVPGKIYISVIVSDLF